MICVYAADATDFSNNGLCVLMPTSCSVTETLNGEWELTMVHPMQELLMQLGYDMGSYGADGKFGAVTEKAVKAFQKKAGIKQDVIYGTDTHTALMNAIAERDDGLLEDSDMEDDKDSGMEDAGKDHADKVESIPVETERLVLITAPRGNINIRYGNGTNFERITSVPPGTKLPYIAAAENGWAAVLVNGKVGWVHPEYSVVDE